MPRSSCKVLWWSSLFKDQFLQKKPAKSAKAVQPPSATPPIYLSGTNIDATKDLVKKIFPNDPAPVIETKAFVVTKYNIVLKSWKASLRGVRYRCCSGAA